MQTKIYFFKSSYVSILSSAFIFFISFFTGCDMLTNNEEDDPDMLYVKFINDSSSVYTITTIELQEMGVAGETSTPGGTWSENILTDGKTIAPGAFDFFDLKIENRHWSQYRIGVDDGLGGEIMLHLQENYQSDWQPSITHWGSDERTVSVNIQFDQSSGLIYISGFSDFAGIE